MYNSLFPSPPFNILIDLPTGFDRSKVNIIVWQWKSQLCFHFIFHFVYKQSFIFTSHTLLLLLQLLLHCFYLSLHFIYIFAGQTLLFSSHNLLDSFFYFNCYCCYHCYHYSPASLAPVNISYCEDGKPQ